jgi:hypothetical protein
MSTVALEKVASDVAKGVTPHCMVRLMHESRHAAWCNWIDPVLRLGVPVSFNRVYLFLLISK